jgi:alkaline phosphatase
MMTTMEFDDQDEEAMELVTRDSLIKSFMVIFTHDHSQHLLLNKDLIDIAFNCLEFCNDISMEAK